MSIQTKADLLAAYPTIAKDLQDEARAAGVKEGEAAATAAQPAITVDTVKARHNDVAAALIVGVLLVLWALVG